MTNALVAQQKMINGLRKAVTQAKTKIRETSSTLKYYRSLESTPRLVELVAEYEAKLAVAQPALAKAEADLAAAEAALPPVKESPFSAILKWFSGASLVKAREALELVDASVEQGCWLPSASRKVRAALKPNVAKKTIKVNHKYNAPKAESAVYYAVAYGSFDALGKLDVAEAVTLEGSARDFFVDFRPLVNTMNRLDATRPMPVFTTMNASRTVSVELKRQGAVSVEVCPIKYELHEVVNAKGEVSYRPVAILVWPEGTQHHTSRYAWGTDTNNQCHACGHAIKNSFNWVPLVLTTEAGEKKSLWVGRDCAETLFGVKMDGELELAEGQR